MKKLLTLCLFTLSTIALLSWGYQGHRTVALIAERHLTPQAKAAIADLLDGQSIADVASWADEVRNQPEYRKTASWHFLNELTGLNESAFKAAVLSQDKENVYTAIQAQKNILTDKAATKEQKAIALKFLIHFVGDLHQPMHISRAEDKGGNTIQVRFDDKGTNLHSLWDSRLLDHEGLSDVQLVDKLDKVSATQVKKWQSDAPMQWLWESYQISSKLYSEIEQGGNKLGDDYYNSHIGIVNDRLEMAGIRLAGVLNMVLNNYQQAISVDVKEKTSGKSNKAIYTDDSYAPVAQFKSVDASSVSKHLGEMVILTDKVYSSRNMGSFYLLNLGAEYPNQLLTVVLRSEAKKLGEGINGKVIRVTGKVIDYKGKPEIEVRETSAISFQ